MPRHHTRRGPPARAAGAPRWGLSGYLVVAVCTLDDIPVALYAKKRQALVHARCVREEPQSNPLYSWDITSFLGVKVLGFKDGRPGQLVFSTV